MKNSKNSSDKKAFDFSPPEPYSISRNLNGKVVMNLDRRPEGNWQYVLPCAFFDGQSKFLSEMQGWEKIMAKDIVNRPENFWTRKEVGAARPPEKWAMERVFYHEKSNLLVMTFDILDQGISYMIWWQRGSVERKFGTAIKAGGSWRAMQEGEDLLKDFEAEERSGICQVVRVCLKTFNKNDGETIAKTVISREM